jgi:hypothetical protein
MVTAETRERPVTPAAVLAEFGEWLDRQPDTPAKQWVLANMPTRADARWAIMRVAYLRAPLVLLQAEIRSLAGRLC